MTSAGAVPGRSASTFRSAGLPGSSDSRGIGIRRTSASGAGRSTSGSASTAPGAASATTCASSRGPLRGLTGTAGTPASSAATIPTAVGSVGVAHTATRFSPAISLREGTGPGGQLGVGQRTVGEGERGPVCGRVEKGREQRVAHHAVAADGASLIRPPCRG